LRTLIIEDDASKLEALSDFLGTLSEEIEIQVARSLNSGLTEALKGEAQLIFLDMTMTNFDRSANEEGGRPHAFAGREILRRMKRHRISTPVIVFTQFRKFDDDKDSMSLEELKEDLRASFENYLDTVEYQLNVDEWKGAVQRLLAKVQRGQVDG
jgi:CheY-like chemotaxis protein